MGAGGLVLKLIFATFSACFLGLLFINIVKFVTFFWIAVFALCALSCSSWRSTIFWRLVLWARSRMALCVTRDLFSFLVVSCAVVSSVILAFLSLSVSRESFRLISKSFMALCRIAISVVDFAVSSSSCSSSFCMHVFRYDISVKDESVDTFVVFGSL